MYLQWSRLRRCLPYRLKKTWEMEVHINSDNAAAARGESPVKPIEAQAGQAVALERKLVYLPSTDTHRCIFYTHSCPSKKCCLAPNQGVYANQTRCVGGNSRWDIVHTAKLIHRAQVLHAAPSLCDVHDCETIPWPRLTVNVNHGRQVRLMELPDWDFPTPLGG